jgi:hypothetical protein
MPSKRMRDLKQPDPLVLKAGDTLIPFGDILRVDIPDIEREVAILHTRQGIFVAEGFDAIEAVMTLKPSALEGKRLKWNRHAWSLHNMIGHPVMQIMAWLGFGRAAVSFHDWTTPRPRSTGSKRHQNRHFEPVPTGTEKRDFQQWSSTRIFDEVLIEDNNETGRLRKLIPKKKNHRKIVQLLQRDGDTCFYCHKPLGMNITVEHLITEDEGGRLNLENTRLTHRGCNLGVRNMTYDEKMEVHRGERPLTPPGPPIRSSRNR